VPVFEYAPRDSSGSAVHAVVRAHVESFLADATRVRDGHSLPRFVEDEFRTFLRCGSWQGLRAVPVHGLHDRVVRGLLMRRARLLSDLCCLSFRGRRAPAGLFDDR